MKEGAGGDDLSVGVRLPHGEFDLPISKGLYLVPGESGTNTRKPGEPVQAVASREPVKIASTVQEQVKPEQPADQSAAIINKPIMQPELMGPQPGQTAEEWISSNNKQSTGSRSGNNQYAAVANNPGNIPGAEMYMNHEDDLEAFELGQQQMSVKSVKRDTIAHPVKSEAIEYSVKLHPKQTAIK